MIQNQRKSSYPEVWGGIECTIARIGDVYYDQLEAAGHYERSSDIRHLAELGIKAIRYPILWERHQPSRAQDIDWRWADRQLHQLKDNNVTPIVGLIHHGSGPAFTDLTRDNFATDLAAYAGLVARRFPWIEYYTPVNEPLTTARFSGLYGVWYPHGADAKLFITMLLNQVKGVVCSMAAIRQVNPKAKLVQTEDISFIQSSPSLKYQADFENHRRWLTYDLLCGMVRPGHPLWDYLLYNGIAETDLSFFSDNPCPPDVVGINYYVTSERFLDDETDKYPTSTHGGNGKHNYADVAAVRAATPVGLMTLLEQVWQRYHLPIAITESHINCTREQQLRWLNETWETACQALKRKIDIRAVTSWALIGAYDWDSLLTVRKGHYESGAYSIKNGRLRLTAVGEMVKMLAATGICDHPLLKISGWWHRQDQTGNKKTAQIHPLLIIGKPDYSKQWFLTCNGRDIHCQLLFSFSAKLTLPYWQHLIRRYRPWGVIIVSDIDTASRTLLSDSCRQEGLPYLVCQEAAIWNEVSIQTAMDLFIDEVMRQKGTIDQLINSIQL